MNDTGYRYTLHSRIPMQDAQDSLVLAILTVECLHGSAQTQLDLAHEFDPKRRTCLIDAATQVGRDLNRLFTGYLQREFGPNSFRVERLASSPAAPPVSELLGNTSEKRA